MVKCACGNPLCRGFIVVAPQLTLFVRDYYGKQVNIQLDEAGVEKLIAELMAQSDSKKSKPSAQSIPNS